MVLVNFLLSRNLLIKGFVYSYSLLNACFHKGRRLRGICKNVRASITSFQSESYLSLVKTAMHIQCTRFINMNHCQQNSISQITLHFSTNFPEIFQKTFRRVIMRKIAIT